MDLAKDHGLTNKLNNTVLLFADRGDNKDEPLESCFQELLDVRCSVGMPEMSAVLVKPDPEDDDREYNDYSDCGVSDDSDSCSNDDHYDQQPQFEVFRPAQRRGRNYHYGINVDKDGWILNDPKFHAILRETSWSAELSSCLKKLNQQEWGQPKQGKEDFLRHAAARCLAESAKRFVLPQNREGALERSDMVVTMETLNQLLVTSKLRYVYSLFSFLYSRTHSLTLTQSFILPSTH